MIAKGTLDRGVETLVMLCLWALVRDVNITPPVAPMTINWGNAKAQAQPHSDQLL